MTHRRKFILSGLAAALPLDAVPPVKIGHRQANMPLKDPEEVFELARGIPGLSGVELQIVTKSYSMWNRATALEYKREANRWGLRIPSVAGIWPPDCSLIEPKRREESISEAIRASELLGASVILIAVLDAKCPDMSSEASYGPAVEALRKSAPMAADAGLVLGLETSLDIEGNRKLVGLVNHPAVRVFWDLDNVERYGFKGQGIGGLEALGANLICQVHCKNEDKLLEEPGRIDWAAAFKTIKRIGYQGWCVLETKHSSVQQCVEATTRNIDFMRRYLT